MDTFLNNKVAAIIVACGIVLALYSKAYLSAHVLVIPAIPIIFQFLFGGIERRNFLQAGFGALSLICLFLIFTFENSLPNLRDSSFRMPIVYLTVFAIGFGAFLPSISRWLGRGSDSE